LLSEERKDFTRGKFNLHVNVDIKNKQNKTMKKITQTIAVVIALSGTVVFADPPPQMTNCPTGSVPCNLDIPNGDKTTYVRTCCDTSKTTCTTWTVHIGWGIFGSDVTTGGCKQLAG
jgi:hypothetical protein